MIIAITGGSGFIGKLLADHHLRNGDKVKILSRNKIVKNNSAFFFHGDLSNPSLDLSEFLSNVDILYHCAGEVINESLMRELHVNGTKRLVDAANGHVGRIVQLSSVGSYGPYRDGLITEQSQEKPLGVYEITKTESDDVIKSCGIPYVIVRPSNVFGNSMPNQSLFQLLKMIRQGLFFFIGGKDSVVNYIHVDDVVLALFECGVNKNAIGNIFIISQSTSVIKMVRSLLIGSNIDKNFIRLPEWFVRIISNFFILVPNFPLTTSRINSFTGKCIYDSSKIKKNLNFEFLTTLEEHFTLFAKQK
jgi:nucleoside-diphosphate-sugar epimerase